MPSNRRRNRRNLLTLVALVAISLVALTLDITGRASYLTSGTKSVADDAYSPIRNVTNDILNPIGRFLVGAVHYGSLQSENEYLRTEISTLKFRSNAVWYQSKEYAALQRLLSLEKLPSISGLPYVIAQSTSQAISNFASTIILDKGRSSGISMGDPVVAGGGLIGQIVAVNASSATVRLLTDGLFKVSVVFGTMEYATLSGEGAGKSLQVAFVPEKTPVHKGQLLTTSGLTGAIFPPGIPVATVTTVHAVAGALDQSITASPLADLRSLAFVSVLEWAPTP